MYSVLIHNISLKRNFWFADYGVLQIKLECVKLAQLYINRVLSELDHEGESAHAEPMQEFLLLQGVRFAFRVHQVLLRLCEFDKYWF